MTIADYAETFEILAKHDPEAGPEAVYPVHEKIEIFVDPADVPQEDIERLEEMRVHAAPDGEPEPHFYVFV